MSFSRTGIFVKEHAMPVIDDEKTYTSPPHKLWQFFERSRDGWKRKYQETKNVVKRLKNRAYAAQKSRDEWKELAKQREQELKQLQRELERQKIRIG
jgi:hypothetical protein